MFLLIGSKIVFLIILVLEKAINEKVTNNKEVKYE